MDEATQILDRVQRYMEEKTRPKPFVPGETPIPYSGTVAGGEEYRDMVELLLTGWFGAGAATSKFERGIAEEFGRRRGVFVNSGSSANLVAVAALRSPRAPRRWERGDEIITAVSGFPTTVNPLIQHDLRPVFVDTSLPTYNPTAEQLAEVITPATKGIMIAHTLGNPYDMRGVMDLVEDHDLLLVEDCCDALGSTYDGRPVGSFGELATCSFYPAHHITTGEGGMVCGDDVRLMKIVESIRDWGRDCWCPPGVDNTCGKRFNWKLGDLPEGYDHKYIYSEIGYNLKPLELQAALGLEQLNRLPSFIETRKRNFAMLSDTLYGDHHLVKLPEATRYSDPSWFAFPITLEAHVNRKAVVALLNSWRIATRMMFGSNLLRQPAYHGLGDPELYPNADAIMHHTFFVGVSPVISEEMCHFMANKIGEAVRRSA